MTISDFLKLLFLECTDYVSACINIVDALQREANAASTLGNKAGAFCTFVTTI